MDYAIEPQANNIAPNQHDYDQLGLIYKHLDSFTTVDTSTAIQAANPRARPYRVVRQDSRREATTTSYFSDGSRRVKHITKAT